MRALLIATGLLSLLQIGQARAVTTPSDFVLLLNNVCLPLLRDNAESSTEAARDAAEALGFALAPEEQLGLMRRSGVELQIGAGCKIELADAAPTAFDDLLRQLIAWAPDHVGPYQEKGLELPGHIRVLYTESALIYLKDTVDRDGRNLVRLEATRRSK